MLPKNRRIERKYFDQILKSGQRYNSTSFLLYLSKIKEGPSSPSRFAFSVSKKVSKLAVERNKLRRRGYSIVGKNIKRINLGFLCFFSYKKGYNKDYSLLEKEVVELLLTLGVII